MHVAMPVRHTWKQVVGNMYTLCTCVVNMLYMCCACWKHVVMPVIHVLCMLYMCYAVRKMLYAVGSKCLITCLSVASQCCACLHDVADVYTCCTCVTPVGHMLQVSSTCVTPVGYLLQVSGNACSDEGDVVWEMGSSHATCRAQCGLGTGPSIPWLHAT